MNACHTIYGMVPCNACHSIWQDYQYGMINYQCMSHYGMVPMHITVWQDFINACMMYQCICMSQYGMMYKCMSHYGVVPIKACISRYCMVPMHVCHTIYM